ncbi:MAG TPA: bifunctional precorrin-2 dehydrogenase/sirohydrochlorin ferrochelatase [Sphingobacteriaceae bacterium]|nr:bifunctional precorrin-2 dehydrogenase/sirohydrochlorin ferrochelatase [Sphingobacteriaceae bacterium]
MSVQETPDKSSGNELFPVFLKLNELQVLLVGAGNIGLEKLGAIINNCPATQIHVVAQEISDDVKELAGNFANITLLKKSFEAADLDKADIVFVATNNPQLNDYIKEEARKRKLLVNFADKPALCNFYLGSVVQKGNLKLGISTNGRSPTLARRLKEVLEEALPSELEETLDNLNKIREMLQGDFSYKVKKLNQITELLISNEK